VGGGGRCRLCRLAVLLCGCCGLRKTFRNSRCVLVVILKLKLIGEVHPWSSVFWPMWDVVSRHMSYCCIVWP
jgi:hypothetical protein